MRKHGAFVLISFILILACSAWQVEPSKAKEDASKERTVALGKIFTVKLGQCVGCQYGWNLTSIDEAYIADKGSKLKRSCQECDGGNGDMIFTFKAITKGTTYLEFRYGKEDPFRMKITIK